MVMLQKIKIHSAKVASALKPAMPLFLSLFMALLFIQLFSPMSFSMGAIQVEARASAQLQGETVFAVPPFGEVKASTHWTPLRITLSLSGLDLPKLEQAVTTAQDREDFVQNLSAEWPRQVWTFALWLLFLATLGGLFAYFLTRAFSHNYNHDHAHDHEGRDIASAHVSRLQTGKLRWRPVISCILAGFLGSAVLIATTAATYNRKAFERPRYVGVLQAAPWIINFIDRGLDHIDEVGRKLEVISRNLTTVFESMDGVDSVSAGNVDLRVLHVSDLHNNPAGLDFVLEVAENFGADLIIDTGDMTDYGTALEASLSERLAKLEIPYLFVPGNHDSEEVVRYLRRLRPVTVLDGKEVRIKGLSICGVGDPASKKEDLVAAQEDYQAQDQLLAGAMRERERPPDILAVHSKQSIVSVEGLVPLILTGHSHRATVRQNGETVIVDAGTTGAAGIRMLQNEEAVPYSVALLHFQYRDPEDESAGMRLTAVDAIRIHELRGSLMLERHVLAEP
jgi:Icc-related predicted phosphoesterase